MKIEFYKYHALQNDFLVIEAADSRIPAAKLGKVAAAVCDRRSGVGADGILYLTSSKTADCKVDVYNADGSWADKSGNGLRITALHLHRKDRRRKQFTIVMDEDKNPTTIQSTRGRMATITTDLGEPSFLAKEVPVRSRKKFHINTPIKLGRYNFPVTCLSVGNPHTVMFVDDFDFDWHSIGEEIENHKQFPHRTNVEFVKLVNRKRIRLADWERGAGATGSSGTGAAAAVCASVMLGLTDHKCKVVFDAGTLEVDWSNETNRIDLTGPAEYIASGTIDLS